MLLLIFKYKTGFKKNVESTNTFEVLLRDIQMLCENEKLTISNP